MSFPSITEIMGIVILAVQRSMAYIQRIWISYWQQRVFGDEGVIMPDSVLRSKHKNKDEATSSWISSLLHCLKKIVYVNESVMTSPVTRRYCRDRGMSPARNSDEDSGACDESTTDSWKNMPRRTPANNNGKCGHVRNGSRSANNNGKRFV
ncbi:hypothetical protein Tco_0612427 [Tanacetum coccineum]